MSVFHKDQYYDRFSSQFLVYINDLPFGKQFGRYVLFADDISVSIKSTSQITAR